MKIEYGILLLLFLIAYIVGYVGNIIKFTQCDFEAPYKCESIHGIGLFPAVGWITGYMDFGK